MMWRRLGWIVIVCFSAFAGGVVAQTISGGVITQTLSGLLFGGALSLSSTPAQISTGLYLSETFSGSCTGQCSGNYVSVTSDNAAVPTGALGTAMQFTYNYGGAALTGNRAGITVNTKLTATSGNATATFPAYAAVSAQNVADANDNGTGLTSTTGNGQSTGGNFIGTLTANATNFWAVGGAEFNTNAQTGSSVYRKRGIQIAQLSSDKVQGTVDDAAVLLGNQNGAVGWQTGFQIGVDSGQSSAAFPLTTTATVMGCGTDCTGSTVKNGIDLTRLTFSGSPILMPLMTPATSSSTCTQGAIEWDAGFVYICTATNTWKRAALSTF